jgi:signal transduction histidine kinase
VFDSGNGITPDDQKNLFKPFAPIGRNSLGLGLAVCKKLIECQNGKISLKSTPGTSTLVTVELPVPTKK